MRRHIESLKKIDNLTATHLTISHWEFVSYEHFLLVALPDFSLFKGVFEAVESHQTEIWSVLAFLSVFDVGHAQGGVREGRRAAVAGAVGGNGLQFYASAVSGAVGCVMCDRPF